MSLYTWSLILFCVYGIITNKLSKNWNVHEFKNNKTYLRNYFLKNQMIYLYILININS